MKEEIKKSDFVRSLEKVDLKKKYLTALKEGAEQIEQSLINV